MVNVTAKSETRQCLFVSPWYEKRNKRGFFVERKRGRLDTYQAFYLVQHQYELYQRLDPYLLCSDQSWIPSSVHHVKILRCQERRNVPSHQPIQFYCHCWNSSPRLFHSIADRKWTRQLYEKGKKIEMKIRENWYRKNF